ncbi:MAG: dihydroorotase [Gammaproteobacteria bacterium]|jgi:dihydroorotase
MSDNRLLLVNGRTVNEGSIREQDVLIVGDRIASIGNALSDPAAEVIDLGGKLLLPGVIDDQVHFRDPGHPDKATIETESRAAICGGVTSFFDMPNTRPPTTDRIALAAKKRVAERTSFANYAFYLGATNTNLEEIRLVTHRDACAIKIFMGASTGNMLVDDREVLSRIFAESRLPVVTHCEDSPMIWAAENEYRARYGDAVPMAAHPQIRSAEACYKSSSYAVGLAKRFGTRLHVLHLTTARELSLFEAGPVENKQITVEVCVHHLWFDESDYERLGTRIKCNPAIKTVADRNALRQGVSDDVVDIIATDHAPHTAAEKARPYFEAPAGLPLVQHMLPALMELHARGVFTLEKIVEKAAHSPARVFGLRERGFIREGYYADLVVVDPNGKTLVTPDQVRYRCGWSPFEGETFSAEILLTICNGSVVFRDGEVCGGPQGRELEFSPRE